MYGYRSRIGLYGIFVNSEFWRYVYGKNFRLHRLLMRGRRNNLVSKSRKRVLCLLGYFVVVHGGDF